MTKEEGKYLQMDLNGQLMKTLRKLHIHQLEDALRPTKDKK